MALLTGPYWLGIFVSFLKFNLTLIVTRLWSLHKSTPWKFLVLAMCILNLKRFITNM